MKNIVFCTDLGVAVRRANKKTAGQCPPEGWPGSSHHREFSPPPLFQFVGDIHAPILAPAFLFMTKTPRPFLTKTGRFNSFRRYSQPPQYPRCRFGTFLTKGKVALSTASLIYISLKDHRPSIYLRQYRCMRLNRLLVFGLYGEVVIREVDALALNTSYLTSELLHLGFLNRACRNGLYLGSGRSRSGVGSVDTIFCLGALEQPTTAMTATVASNEFG